MHFYRTLIVYIKKICIQQILKQGIVHIKSCYSQYILLTSVSFPFISFSFCSCCFSHCVMLPLNLTPSSLFETVFFEHLFNLYCWCYSYPKLRRDKHMQDESIRLNNNIHVIFPAGITNTAVWCLNVDTHYTKHRLNKIYLLYDWK